MADVGQNDIEEVDVVEAGGNYGWAVKEGTFLFEPGGPLVDGSVTANSPGAPAGLSDPIAEYDHTAPGGVRCGRGARRRPARASPSSADTSRSACTGSSDHYVFGDYSRAFAQPLGRLFVLRHGQVEALPDPGIAVFGFGQDKHGDLYVLGNTTGVCPATPAWC